MSSSNMFKAIIDWIMNKFSFITDTRSLKMIAFIITITILRKIYKSHEKQKIRSAPFRPRILIIGAGMSGINAAVNLKTKLQTNNFIIYDNKRICNTR
eukprot:415220_1